LRLPRFANRFLAFATISNRLPPDALLSTWTPLSACSQRNLRLPSAWGEGFGLVQAFETGSELHLTENASRKLNGGLR
jgi:hypothetical protein